MNLRITKIVLSFFIIFSTVSCSVLEQSFQKPDVYINQVQLDTRNFLSPKLIITLNVVNPNPFDIAVTGMEYRVNILDTNVLSGASNTARNFKALSESPLVLEANTDITQLLSLASKLRNIKKGASVPYSAALTIHPQAAYIPSITINKADQFKF